VSDLEPYTKAYIEADGGLVNGRVAIDYALENLPEVDPDRLYACGHSSAGGQALALSWEDKRIRACCAYDSSIDIVRWWDNPAMAFLIPDLPDFATRKSALVHAEDFRCPVLIFHAEDDSVVPFHDAERLCEKLHQFGKDVTFEHVPTGDHYDGMIQDGIPDGIKFMIDHGADPKPPLQ
jgi:dipeptidyl aminopeptidase/acylaminoacyl peptidase